MIISKPNSGEIICKSATATTAGLVTVPAGRWYTCTIALAVTVTVAGTSTPTVTITAAGGSTGVQPDSGTVVAGITAAAVATNSGQDSNTFELICFGGTNGATLDYAVTSATASRCIINGFLL